ncbi:MAG: pseudaminic acid biosynthesis-associated methylase [Pseudomonadaceae bacterium]|nr:pseudaminic acid biosynthesis-associated methylase [Pseudomonadaceae bacterium]
MKYTTEQENFWAGEFGDNYINRNNSEKLLFSKVAMWSNILRSANSIKSVKELGCNIGLNLLALNKLNPELKLSGVEINAEAARHAKELKVAQITNGTILEEINSEKSDLVFTAGVLIHINPDHLKSVYDNLVNNSNRYVMVAEYYNPSPVNIDYRGNEERLFKRDFAGELIEQYGLKLIDYGFIYKRDNWAPQDDITWFLLEK